MLLAICTCTTPGSRQPVEDAASDKQFSPLLSLYRGPLNHLAAVRSGSCPMYPSCSLYSQQAIDKHGPVTGWIMTLDRLTRCGRDEVRKVPRILVDGQWKFYDPVSANDSWWHATDDQKDTDPKNRHLQ